MNKSFAFLLCLGFIQAGSAQIKQVFGRNAEVYIVRHAEKEKGADPLLTIEGNKRAGDLMRTLKDKKIRRIYVTQYKRTQSTADSLHLQLGIDTIHYQADTSCLSLFAAIEKNGDRNGPILIVTHSNIIPKILYYLGITDFPQQNIPEEEFDNIYRVSYENKKAVLTKSKFGKPSGESARMN